MTIEHPELNASAIMAAADKRISSIAKRFGVNSPETLAACERWGGILDDVNYPDTTCRNCGHPVTYIPVIEKYVHSDYAGPVKEAKVVNFPAAVWCITHAGAEAEPITDAEREQAATRLKPSGVASGRMSNTDPDLSTIPGKHPITKKPARYNDKGQRMIGDNPQA